MNENPSTTGGAIPRITCPACGARMNPHAEKPVAPVTRAEAARADSALGALIEEIHACPGCGRVEARASD